MLFKKLYLRFMDLLELFEKKYESIRISGFESKYLSFLSLKNYLINNFFSEKKSIGKSFLGNEIYSLKLGNGNLKVLVWSQMHGNESTGTKAMLDVFEFLQFENEWCKSILENITLHFVPMLNPDGASVYTRRNACGIDLNRDFLKESSPEIKILKAYVQQVQPDFLFNLHDQRSIFNVGDTKEPATMAFLAPAADIGRSLNETRKKSMAVIDYIYNELSKVLPGKIALFSDEFYPASTGDNFMLMGYPTILFEAGHFPNDYQRDHSRRFNALSILLGLEKISKNEEPEIGNYFDIPENNKKFLDVVLRNTLVKSNDSEALLDIGIYFEEKLNQKEQKLEYCSRIEEIGDLSSYFGHVDIDTKGKIFVSKSEVYPQIGSYADFSVGNVHFDKGKFSG